jgi:uncharacterized protein YndB with AHSA1/START domain
MIESAPYKPGPAHKAQIQKNEGDKWTLILVRELRHPPEKVWRALTEPAQLREWAPFETDGSLGAVGTVKLTWMGASMPLETTVTRADAPRVLEYNDTRWELEASGGGTRLKLWHSIDRRFIAMGAAGWHISFDALDGHLAGQPIGRAARPDMKSSNWQRLYAEYAQQFGTEQPSCPPKERRVEAQEETP